MGRNEGFAKWHLLDAAPIVTSIDAPSPTVEKTDANGVLRTIEGTAHAHEAVVMECNALFGIDVNVACRTLFDATLTQRATILFYAIEEGVEVAGNVLWT